MNEYEVSVVLDKGVVAEAGKHDTLMKKNGLYRKLVDLQPDATNWKLSGLRVSFDNATKLNIKKNNMTSLYGRNCAK